MIRKVATSIDQLTTTQLQTAKELATFFCAVKDNVHEGQDIAVPILFEICASVFEIEPETMKGRIKPYHKHQERHAQFAFLWAARFYSNEWFAGVDFLGCNRRSIRQACDEFSSHLHYQKEICKFKYEQQRKTYSDKLLLIIAACHNLCPSRKSLFIAAGIVPPTPQTKPTKQPESTNGPYSMQDALEHLKRAQATLQEAEKLHAENLKRLKALADQFSKNSPTGIAQCNADLGKMRYDVKANGGSKLSMLKDRKERLFTTFIN